MLAESTNKPLLERARTKKKLGKIQALSTISVTSVYIGDEQSDAKAAHSAAILLDDFSFAFNGSRPLQLTGRVFHQGSTEGERLEYTSQIVSVDGRIATTRSGTRYRLGEPAKDFFALRERLCLARYKRAAQTEAYDSKAPFAGIDIGTIMPTIKVCLPKIAGWDPDSPASLLNEWEVRRDDDGRFVRLRGTAFNCPGVQDGARGYETADIVDVEGRIVRTVRGELFYLGELEELMSV